MPDRVPSPEELQVIRLRAQTCRQATSRVWNAEHRLQTFSRHDRSAGRDEAIVEQRGALEAWRAAREDLDSFSKSGRLSPRGWSPRVLEMLHKITEMCEWSLDFLIQAELDPTLGLEEEIESLAAAAPTPPATPTVPTVPTCPTGEGLVAGGVPPIDFRALVDALLFQGKTAQAALVRFMADKEAADVQDVGEAVHDDKATSDNTIMKNVQRTNLSLEMMASPLSFHSASGRVFRRIGPA
jgi:hypothetical protein